VQKFAKKNLPPGGGMMPFVLSDLMFPSRDWI